MQVIHTYAPLSPSSIIWYQLWLGIKTLVCGYGDVEFCTGLHGCGCVLGPTTHQAPLLAPFYSLLFVLTRSLPTMQMVLGNCVSVTI